MTRSRPKLLDDSDLRAVFDEFQRQAAGVEKVPQHPGRTAMELLERRKWRWVWVMVAVWILVAVVAIVGITLKVVGP